MKWRVSGIAAVALAMLCATAPPSSSGTRVGTVHIGDPYRGATLDFPEEPAVQLVPSTMVYYVRDRDCDLYRYGRYWYFLEDGYWYRARSWQGPFLHLQESSVPRSIRTVPLNYRRHWPGPSPQAMAPGYYKRPAKR